MKPKRPLLLWLLSIILIGASFRYLLQALFAIQSWNLLVAIHYRFGPLYPIFQGVFLAVGFLLSAILLLRQVKWAPALSSFFVIFAMLWAWLDKTVLNLDPQPLKEQLFAIIFSALALVVMLGGLWSIHPNMILSKKERIQETSGSSSKGEENEPQ
ncbi:MAG: hypothetical protein AB9897_03870 [Anaerolineaceae bacterium]